MNLIVTHGEQRIIAGSLKRRVQPLFARRRRFQIERHVSLALAVHRSRPRRQTITLLLPVRLHRYRRAEIVRNNLRGIQRNRSLRDHLRRVHNVPGRYDFRTVDVVLTDGRWKINERIVVPVGDEGLVTPAARVDERPVAILLLRERLVVQARRAVTLANRRVLDDGAVVLLQELREHRSVLHLPEHAGFHHGIREDLGVDEARVYTLVPSAVRYDGRV